MRIFIAINLPIDLKKNIASLINSLPKQFSNIPWQNQINWHVTLHFLGEINSEQLIKVFQVIENVAAQFSTFIIELKNFMAFPSLAEPKIIALKIKTSQKLDKIVKLFKAQINHMHFGNPDNKKFKPHITLARLKMRVGDYSFLEKINLDKKIKVTKIDVMESILKSDGAHYRILKSFTLKNES